MSRQDCFGVSSVISWMKLQERIYKRILHLFHSKGVNLQTINTLWVAIVFKLFKKNIVFVNDRIVIIGDGIKIPKEGKKMPAVKSLHQESENNTKPEYIMGHSFQSASILIKKAGLFLAISLVSKIHEGVKFNNNDKKTLLDKFFKMMQSLLLTNKIYYVLDAYYSAGKLAKMFVAHGDHLITRADSNAVAYEEVEINSTKKVGRPKKYGIKIKLQCIFNTETMSEISCTIYGNNGVKVQYWEKILLWKSYGLVKFVGVNLPGKGKIILMTTDLTLTANDIIELYCARMKIESGFKAAIHVIGTCAYHFWMKEMEPIKRKSGTQYLHKKTKSYREKVKEKIKAFEFHVLMGIIAQGLLQYLAVYYTKSVWGCFNGWLRTISKTLIPSEYVVKSALQESYFEFLLTEAKSTELGKFLLSIIDKERLNNGKFKVKKAA